jgi:hypothetical protein
LAVSRVAVMRLGRVRSHRPFQCIPQLIPLSLDLGEPGPQRLHLGVQLAGIDCQFDALLLRFGELEPQLGVLDSKGEQVEVDAHPNPFRTATMVPTTRSRA